MKQTFLNISSGTWNIIFLIIRYVVVALFLAYITNVYMKRKAIHTDIKGRVLEWRVARYKEIHRWVMKTQNVIAAPGQDEEHYRRIVALTRFKVGYQGMEYASFFDSKENLIQFLKELNEVIQKDEDYIDFPLLQLLRGFLSLMDDVVMLYRAFLRTEYDARWEFDNETKERHCNLACKLLGIALQKDVNQFYGRIDNMLRDRLGNLKISDIYAESLLIRMKRRATEFCEDIMSKVEDDDRRLVKWVYYHVLYRNYGCSQLLKNQQSLFTIFMYVHFEDLFTQTASSLDGMEGVGESTKAFWDCFYQYLER